MYLGRPSGVSLGKNNDKEKRGSPPYELPTTNRYPL